MYNEAKKASNAKYLSQFKTISVRVKNDEAKELESKAAGAGESLAKYIMNACRERMTGKYECMPHESDTEALPDLLTPNARQTAKEASEAAGVPLADWLTGAIERAAVIEAEGRRLTRELAAFKAKEKE